MRLAGNIVGIVLLLLGALWIAQGSNILAGSAMSGQSLWLWVGVVVVIVGAIALWWANRRR